MGKEELKTVFGSTHVFEQLSFSMFPSILTFDFDLIMGSLFTFSFYISFNSNIDFDLILGSLLIFWGPKGLFLGWGRVQKLFWGLVINTKNFCF